MLIPAHSNVHSQALIDKLMAPVLLTPYQKKEGQRNKGEKALDS